MLWWVCSVIKRRRQNVARASVALSAAPRGHILPSCEIYCCKEARRRGMCLLLDN